MFPLIIVDAKRVAKYPLQAIADYIALLALTRIGLPDHCSTLPSIINLFAAGCEAPPPSITEADTAYLKALYGTNLEMNLNIEQGGIRLHMVHEILKK